MPTNPRSRCRRRARKRSASSPLSALDEVAYLRFASVYRAFESADDFESEIAQLRARPRDCDELHPAPGVHALGGTGLSATQLYEGF